MNNRFEILLQPFSKTITDDFICEFTCPQCKEKVRSTPRVQADLAYGGVGHKCSNCSAYIAILCCPNCKANLTIDDQEWEKLAEPNGVECPSCNAVIFRKKENWLPKIISSGIIFPGLNTWSCTNIEESYLLKLRQKYSNEEQNILAIRHHSVGVRMKSAKDCLKYLIDNDWYSPLVISNSSDMSKEDGDYKTPFDQDFHNNLFGFINNLRSALDIISQEIAYIINPEVSEKKVDLLKINEVVKLSPELKEYIDSYIKSESFQYLNKLRNVLQHRRIPLMVTVGSYETSELKTIRPKNIRSIASIRLPQNPNILDEAKNSNSFNVMLFPKIKEIHDDTVNFMLSIYRAIIP